MLQIINKAGLTLHLFSDTFIPIERNNPLFLDSDTFGEDVTYSFSFPDDAYNKEFTRNGQLVEAENSVYELEVQTLFFGTTFFAGVLSYSYENLSFKGLLKVNLGAVGDKIKTVKVSEIYTGDVLPAQYTAANMLAVCANPNNYPYSFFPVYNEAWDPENKSTSFLVNAWDHESQKFQLIGRNNTNVNTASGPFWKLKYIIAKVMAFLGFECAGTWYESLESETIFIYTRIASMGNIMDSLAYMPSDLLITDFLKICRDRHSLSFSFDLFNGRVTIKKGIDIINDQPIDIRNYITEIFEIARPEVQGYNITLKPDDQDELFKDPVNPDENVFVPTNVLAIGNEEKPVEINCSTLKSKSVTDYSMPETKQVVFPTVTEDVPQFPLRFLTYKGMKSVAGGKVFPEAKPMELSLEDGKWFKFLNDSKKVRLKAAIPFFELIKIDALSKLTIISRENHYAHAIIEKIRYNLKNDEKELIEVDFDCRVINSGANTISVINPYETFLAEDAIRPRIKAYFSSSSIANVAIEMYYEKAYDGTVADPGSVRIDAGAILQSTDKFGTGGKALVLPEVRVKLRNSPVELRVKSGVPKYAVVNNIKIPFQQRGDYWFADNIFSRLIGQNGIDGRGVWIVF